MPRSVLDDSLVAVMRAAPRSAWLRFLDAVDVLGLVDEYGIWRGGVAVDGEDGIIDMPWVEYCDEVTRVIVALHGIRAIVEVDCVEVDLSRQVVSAELAAIGDVVRLISTIMHVERFSQGQLLRSLDDGSLQSLLRRLASWYRTDG